MKILLLVFLISAASADEHCTGLYIGDDYYNVEIIKDGINRVHELVYNRNDGSVYFTFEQIAEVPTRELGYVRLADRSAGVIKGIRNATGLAMDQNLNKLYVGGSDGLYVIDLKHNNSAPEKLPVNHDIISLFLKNNVLYFVNRRKEAYKIEYDIISPILELQGYAVDKFVLDDDNNIIFLQFNKASRVRIGSNVVNSYDKLRASDVATDVNFKPYVCADEGLYVYNKYKYVLDKVGNLPNIRKLAFINANEPIYMVVDNLIRLKKAAVPCYGD